MHGFSPPEIHHFTKVSKLPLRDVLERLKAAGLGSLPGGGAEILVDRVRKAITRGKVMTDDWLNVNRVWHELGGRSTATMMFGHIETIEERIEHFERVRQLQDETGGFTAFISWTFQPDHTDMADVPPAGAFEYLKNQAISRLYLDNVPNIQSSWVTQGPKIGQVALYFGANDMGSLMIEENVVSSAGTVYHLSLEEIRRAIRECGYIPRQRNVFYEYIDAGAGHWSRPPPAEGRGDWPVRAATPSDGAGVCGPPGRFVIQVRGSLQTLPRLSARLGQRDHGHLVRMPARGDLRAARAQWGRQDDDAADPEHGPEADGRPRDRGRARRR